MKNIQKTAGKIQTFYASDFVTMLFFIATIEIYVLFMVFLGGAR